MKKTALVMVMVMMVVAIFAFATGCSADTKPEAETTTTENTTTETETITSKTYDFGEIPEAETTITTAVVDYEEILREIAGEKLRIGFDTHAHRTELDGNILKVYGPQEGWTINAMFVENQFMDEHKVVFETTGKIEKYIPPAFEEADFPEDGFGCVLKEELKTRTAIRFEGTLKITIDDKYIIIVNPKDTTGIY